MISDLPVGERGYDSLILDNGRDFKVDPRIYTSPAIFDEEMARIFESTWIYAGHTSEIQNPGDFKTAMIGRNSVVLSRGDDGKPHVFLNSCRHRGNAVCRQPRGSVRNFKCHYHGWTYSRTGDLLAVTKPDGYPKDFVARLGGLIQLKVAEYRGLIFASLNDRAPDIETHLGDVRKYVDLWADLSPEPEFRVARPHLYDYQANWKFQAENGHDGWHARFVHESAFQTMADFGGTPSSQRSTAGLTRAFDRGFALLERAGLPQGLTPIQQEEYREALGRGRSPEQVETLWHVRQIYLFPNAFLFDNLIRVIEPTAVDRTSVSSYPLIPRGLSEGLNRTRFRELQSRLSTTGMVSEDDLEMFVANQTGMRNTKLPWIDLSHGLGQEVPVSGSEVVGEDSSELPQRAMYREWLHLMGARGRRAVTTIMKLSRTEAEDFLYREPHLLDSQAYSEWLKLFTDDGIYWLPMYDDADPTLDTSILYDDSRLREMRVYQLVNKPRYAQIPPSRTAHFISNVTVTSSTRDDENVVHCTTMVAELRAGDHQQLGLGNQRIFAGHCEYYLRNCGDLKIALKKLTLIQRDVPIENLSFLL